MGTKQTAKVCAIMYAVMGLVYSIIGIFMVIFGSGPVRIQGIVFILMPILLVVMGYLMVAFSCWFYNKVAARMGGIEFELTSKE